MKVTDYELFLRNKLINKRMQQGRIFTEMMETIFAQSAEMLQLLCAPASDVRSRQ